MDVCKLVLLNGKLGVMRVVTSQWGLTRPSSIFFSLGIVRDVVPPVICNVMGILEDFSNCFSCSVYWSVSGLVGQLIHHFVAILKFTGSFCNIAQCPCQNVYLPVEHRITPSNFKLALAGFKLVLGLMSALCLSIHPPLLGLNSTLWSLKMAPSALSCPKLALSSHISALSELEPLHFIFLWPSQFQLPILKSNIAQIITCAAGKG